MVRVDYAEIDQLYGEVKRVSCGRTACSILIFVAEEVDAIAAAKMLTQVLEADHIAYMLRSVSNFTEIMQSFEKEKTGDIRTIFMINCGATRNIPKLFDLSSGGDLRCFILDNHRPFHLANLFSRHNVVVFDDDIEAVVEEGLTGDASSVSEADSKSEEEKEEGDGDDGDDGSEYDDADILEDVQDEEEARIVRDNEEEEEDGEFEEEEENQGDDEAGGGEEEEEVEEEEGEEGEEAGDDGDEREARAEDGDDEIEDAAAAVGTSVTEVAADNEEENNVDEEQQDIDVDDIVASVNNDNERKGGMGDGGEEEEDEIVVVGKRRRELEEEHDPEKIRRRKIATYYATNCVQSGVPTSIMMMHFVSGGRFGSHPPLDMLWQAMIGLMDQYRRGNLTETKFLTCVDQLKSLLANHMDASENCKYLVRIGEEEIVVPGSETGNIIEGPEYRFQLYRHWSLFDAMSNSPYIAAKLGSWKTTISLQEMLAVCGVPIDDSKQLYQHMPSESRDSFRSGMYKEKIKTDYHLTDPDPIFRCFFRYNSYRNPVSAMDVACAAAALVEGGRLSNSFDTTKNSNKTQSHALIASKTPFESCLDCMNIYNESALFHGLQAAISLQQLIMRKAALLMEDSTKIVRVQRMYFTYVHRVLTSNGDNHFAYNKPTSASAVTDRDKSHATGIEMESPFCRPQVLTSLGRLLVTLKRRQSRREGGWQGKRLMPLLLLAEKADTYVIVGISPLASVLPVEFEDAVDDSHMTALRQLSNFRQFFKLAAKEIDAKVQMHAFDANVIEIDRADAHDFLGTLDYAFKKASPLEIQKFG